MPRLSIIIPVLGSSARLETTLVSVLENRPPDCEIIVVLNAAYDDPYDLGSEVRFLRVGAGGGLVECINEGVQASRAPVVHLLSSGIEVADGWTAAALEHFRDPRVASVAPAIVDALDRRTTIALGLEYSCAWGRLVCTADAASRAQTADQQPARSPSPSEILGPLRQAAFYRRSALELAGGFPRAVGDSLADVDLALTLRFAGYRSMLEPGSIVFAGKGDLAPPKTGFRQGLAAERLFWRAARVVGWCKSLAAHPLGIVADHLTALPSPGALTTLFGRLVGFCQMRSHRAHHQWLLDVQRTAASLFRATRPQHLRIDGPHERFQAASEDGTRVSVRSGH